MEAWKELGKSAEIVLGQTGNVGEAMSFLVDYAGRRVSLFVLKRRFPRAGAEALRALSAHRLPTMRRLVWFVRKVRITKQYYAGLPMPELCRRFGISRVRVYQIVRGY